MGVLPVRSFHLLTHLGPGWCVFRVRYALRLRLRLLERRCPATPWAAFANEYAEGRFPVRDPDAALPDDPAVEEEAAAIRRGEFLLYSRHRLSPGFPPEWNRDPFTGASRAAERHWSRLSDFEGGDIKDVWELSRFPWAFPLARAYARDGDEGHAEAFWRLATDWMEKNLPNLGPQWKCGQEATFRLMAFAFARHAFSGCKATTPARVASWRAFVLATGRRVAANIDYALSQSNNHGVSECVGLISCACLLPGAPEARGWLASGLRSLCDQVGTLVYEDGSFSQHAVNYHRVLLQDLCWVSVLLEANGHAVPGWLSAAGARATAHLDSLVDRVSGHAPCAGSNDGAHILPLAPGGYRDFRPVLALAAAVFEKRKPVNAGSWEEACAWLAPAAQARAASVTPSRSNASLPGGWHTVHAGDSWILFRAPVRFRHRPAQADLLHVDLWWRGLNLLQDPGSYSYNSSGVFASGFKQARVHNTVTFDGLEPMKKAGRFLYLPWPRGVIGGAADAPVASHDGWSAVGAFHERRITVIPGGWRIEDRLRSSLPRLARVHWLCADLPVQFDPNSRCLTLEAPFGRARITWRSDGADFPATLVRADPTSDRGWASPYYREVVPALSLAVEVPVHGERTFVTEVLLQPDETGKAQEPASGRIRE